MARTIQEYVAEREITYLVHFTRTSNLDSILQRGLVTRNTLLIDGYNDFNDQHRIDGTDAICLSIGFPNYKMFYRLRKENIGVSWVVLAIKPEVLWTLRCAFCATNAASNCVTNIPLDQRTTLAALQAMYADWGDMSRTTLGIPSYCPTNPQAEVLMLNGVPRPYIYCVAVATKEMKLELETKHPGLDVRHFPNFFYARLDYAHWKQAV